jgi:hypothetical protein
VRPTYGLAYAMPWGEITVDTAEPRPPNCALTSLMELRRTPLHRMRTDCPEAVDMVARRVIPEEPLIASVDFTAFNSSI